MIGTLLGVGILLSVALAYGDSQVPPPAGMRVRAGDLKIVLGESATAPERRAAELLAAEVLRRTGLQLPIGTAAGGRLSLLLGTAASSAARRCSTAVGV